MTDEWRAIETVPKDGRWVRVKRANKEAVVRWSHALDDWSFGPAQETETKAERLLNWEPTEWAPALGSSSA